MPKPSIATAPSNIALIKYWGKKPAKSVEDINIGLNPSLSMTLSQAHSRCELLLGGESLHISINGKAADSRDEMKIKEHIDRICRYFSFETPKNFTYKSSNNFPQGTGLASSASAFCALSLAAIAEIVGTKAAQDYLPGAALNSVLSRLSRMGSGSAARSASGPFMYWDGPFAKNFASSWKLYDTIIVLSTQHKKISSREGHELSLTSPEFPMRLQRLPERTKELVAALFDQDLARLGPILEAEAMEMHQIAQTAETPIDYLLPETRKMLSAIRRQTERDYYFTLDAGPNIHVISSRPITTELKAILKEEKIEANIWEDWTGQGPVLVS